MRALILWMAGVVFSGGLLASPGYAPLDFSQVDTVKKADALVAQGKLFKVPLSPEIGCRYDDPGRYVYVPLGFPRVMQQIYGQVAARCAFGEIDRVWAKPSFRGTSLVPTRIDIDTFRGGYETQNSPIIRIW